MKTQKNNQETGNNLVTKVVLFGSAVVLSAVLIGKTTSAQISQGQLSNSNEYGMQTLLAVGQFSDTKEADAVFEIINAEVSAKLNNSTQTSAIEETMPSETEMVNVSSLASTEIALEKAVEYNPEKFVEAELAMEKESLTNDEAVEAESAHQIEVLTNESQYNADKFVEAEIELEIENVKANDELLESAEAPTASVADQEISKYAERVILVVEAEEALADVSCMNNEGFFTEAQQFTARGADEEVAKYAKKTLQKIETEGTQVAESKMTTNDDFNSPEA